MSTDAFIYRDGELYCEGVSVRRLCEEHGTPLYIYSRSALVGQFEALATALAGVDHVLCYAIKSNSNLAVISTLAQCGAGADVVSGGELFRALKAGVPAGKIVYAGVGKSDSEIRAALQAGILLFNVESVSEGRAIARIARDMGTRAPVALRVNPDVDAKTHAYTTTGRKGTKFGIDLEVVVPAFEELSKLDSLDVCGVHAHIGSPVTTVDAYDAAFSRLTELVRVLKSKGIDIRRLNIGGGLPIVYRDEQTIDLIAYAERVKAHVHATGCQLILEPGRFISGNSGILCTQVLYRKETDHKTFVIVDGSMTELLRPALYGSWHRIAPIVERERRVETVDVVGPVCESGDFLAKDREMPRAEEGEYLVVFSAGAYGFAMSSNYNARPRPAELLVIGDKAHVVRQRETYEDLVRGESIPDAVRAVEGP